MNTQHLSDSERGRINHSRSRPLPVWLAALAVLCAGLCDTMAQAGNTFAQSGLGILAVTNQHSVAIYVGVDDVWQGVVPAKTTAYMPVEGFVTQDSGFDAEGNLNIKHAFGGFEVKPSMEFKFRSVSSYPMPVPGKPGESKATMIEGTDQFSPSIANSQGIAWCIVGPGPYDFNPVFLESMVKITEGRPRGDWSTTAAKLGEPYQVSGKEAAELAGSGSSGGGQITVYGGLGGGTGAGTNFTTSNGMEMIWVEPGSVLNIRISEGYYLGKTEVTQAQWQEVMGSNPSNFKGANLPVDKASWNAAMEFCRKLTERDRASGKLPKGYIYTLPTEEQWEYACRAGTTGDYARPLNEMAWYRENSGSRTHPVGTKRANAWGFHDMHGNVSEWCLNPYERGRALRGGSWVHGAEDCRSDSRYWGFQDASNDFTLGFRPAAVPSGR